MFHDTAHAIAQAISNGRNVLEIADAVLAHEEHGHATHLRGSLRADAGDLVLIQVVELHQAELWGDVAVGLMGITEGRVSILGNDLSELDAETLCWLRGRIGRVFSRGNWINRLSLLDNILLPSRHHSGRDDADLKADASLLAAAFDLPGIPLGTPDSFARADLQRAACVRAFLNDPLLVILEDPTYGGQVSLLKPLIDTVRAARNRGAAVLWFSHATSIWRDRSIPVTRRYRVAGNELMEIEVR